jgi:hypothetical protein
MRVASAEAKLQSFVMWTLHMTVSGQLHGMAASCPELYSAVTIGLKSDMVTKRICSCRESNPGHYARNGTKKSVTVITWRTSPSLGY